MKKSAGNTLFISFTAVCIFLMLAARQIPTVSASQKASDDIKPMNIHIVIEEKSVTRCDGLKVRLSDNKVTGIRYGYFVPIDAVEKMAKHVKSPINYTSDKNTLSLITGTKKLIPFKINKDPGTNEIFFLDYQGKKYFEVSSVSMGMDYNDIGFNHANGTVIIYKKMK